MSLSSEMVGAIAAPRSIATVSMEGVESLDLVSWRRTKAPDALSKLGKKYESAMKDMISQLFSGLKSMPPVTNANAGGSDDFDHKVEYIRRQLLPVDVSPREPPERVLALAAHQVGLEFPHGKSLESQAEAILAKLG
jgi:hypothetical protein